MGFSPILRITRELWKEWELRLLTVLSLFLQLTLATQGSRRKSISKIWIQFLVWTTYLLAESVATLTLGVLSNRLANIKETKGTFDPQSQITAFWAPFLLVHLGGPDTITAFALADNELWLRQLARLCFQVGLACYIYYMALSGSTLSLIAEGMILVGFIKYAEKTLCLYFASKDRLRDSLRSLPNFGPIYPRKMEQYLLKRNEGYQVRFDEVKEFSAPVGISASGQAYSPEKTLVKAYELFNIFKLLFIGLILNAGDMAASKRIFMGKDVDSLTAFRIMEIELGFMYDLLYTKAKLLNFAWSIIRWTISLTVPCAVLVLFSLKDKKGYPKVDIWITFLLLSMTILLEIYSLLLAISSDWVENWRLQKPERSTISSTITFLRVFPNHRWWNSVAQFSILRFSIRKGKRIFHKCPRLARLEMNVEKNFYIGHKEFKNNIKEWILNHLKDMIEVEGPDSRSKGMVESTKLAAHNVLTRSNCDLLYWSVDTDFDRSILIWHIATELCYYKDRGKIQMEDLVNSKMSKLVSRYMLYLLVFHPSMLPIGAGAFQYEDTLVDAQKFLEDKQAVLSKKEDSISSVIKWAKKLLKIKPNDPPVVCSCKKDHKSRESQDLCKVCHLLLKVRHPLPVWKMHGDKSTSVLFDACYLAEKLTDVPGSWEFISKVWARMLMSAACQSKGIDHCESLSRGGELLSHVWLLMAHFGIALPEQTPGVIRSTKLIVN
ncbi:hypothetical protein BT93_L3827 [Corymbia citriodora subsp. variegata]|uniref:DUF4220 domain-containing protein n=1 Tax=Corymbia citriodora subsp. variegata TaxID=360336 RepID=A0A8T0CV22_CORYI|nr:hypothetical protein BT93_L3827 [Corymbia citriodora subsp. variegata]